MGRKIKLKYDTRGGSRKRKKLKTGQARLLDCLWELFGGIVKVSKIIGVVPQQLINWKLRDGVAFKWCVRVSDELKVPQIGLNYKVICSLRKPSADIIQPLWPDVVALYFTKDTEDYQYIIEGSHPKV